MAMIDSGSPVSLIKESYVPWRKHGNLYQVSSILIVELIILRWILSTFQSKITVNNIDLDIKFLVVPDTTMAFVALLGRDFISSPIINISFGKDCVISKRDNNVLENNEIDNFQRQIMHIEYIQISQKI